MRTFIYVLTAALLLTGLFPAHAQMGINTPIKGLEVYTDDSFSVPTKYRRITNAPNANVNIMSSMSYQ